MILIGTGTGRKVYSLLGDLVLKIPYTEKGIKQSALEWKRSKQKEWQNYIAAILDYDAETGIMVMERLYNCQNIFYPNQKPEHKPFFDLVKLSGIQVGKDKNGELKLYDYGDFVECIKG